MSGILVMKMVLGGDGGGDGSGNRWLEVVIGCNRVGSAMILKVVVMLVMLFKVVRGFGEREREKEQ